MLKQINSTILLLAMVFGTLLTAPAQNDDSYAMWENIMLTPDNTKLKALGDAMRAHNQKYHAEGVYEATVFNISSGPNAGNLIWSMGPVMFKHMDARPGEGGHDEDWRDNVMPNIKKTQTVEYWGEFDSDIQNTSILDPNTVTHPIFFVRIYEIVPGQGFNLGRFFENVSKAVKALDGENPWGVYDNQFIQGRDIGRHIAEISFYKDWADFDTNRSFRAAYEKVHGANSWQGHVNMRNATFHNRWDEVWVYNKKMSGK